MRWLTCIALLAVAGCSWFGDAEVKKRAVRTTPDVPYFLTESQAKVGCGADTVVWGDSTALLYYPKGSASYRKTAHGALMCQRVAEAGGYHAAG